MKLPYMPLWANDIDSDRDCRKMSDAQFGRYMRLLIRQWIEGSVPATTVEAMRDAMLDPGSEGDVQSLLDRKFSEKIESGRGNPRLNQVRLETVEKCIENRQRASKAGKASAAARGSTCSSTTSSTASSTNSQPRASDSDSDSESFIDSSGESAEGGGNRGSPDDLVFPLGSDCLDTPEFRAQWDEWLAYRTEKRFGRLASRTVQSQLLKLAKVGHDRAIETIRLSIENDWKGLFPDKTGGRGAGGDRSSPQARAEARRADKASREHPEDAELTFK